MEDQMLSLIQKSGLTRITDDVTALLRYTISIKTLPVGEAELPLGISKIGGLPDLPPEIDWPEWDNQPLPLIAQIRLADIAPYDRFGELPHTGMLYFFFNEETLDMYSPARGSWCVLHYNGDIAHLRRGLASSDEQQLFYPTCAITFSTTLTLPPFESLYLERLGLSYDAYRREAPFEQRREVVHMWSLQTARSALRECVPISSVPGTSVSDSGRLASGMPAGYAFSRRSSRLAAPSAN